MSKRVAQTQGSRALAVRTRTRVTRRQASADSMWSEAIAARIVAALIQHAPASELAEPHLHAAIAGTVTRPGKLLRARLVLATTRAHGISDETGVRLATAVEYFHLSSLLLDDLPCMDDAITRRGQPCAHRLHGDATAILAALAFINRAYALIGAVLAAEPMSVRQQANVCLDHCLGTAGLVGGQARDLGFAASDRSAREVSRIAVEKTGTMIALGLLLPALLACPTAAELRALNALCVYWGIAFQGLDDLRDVLCSNVDAGKTTGRDRALTRPNLAVVVGVPAARRRIARLLAHAALQVEKLLRMRNAWAYLRDFQNFLAASAEPIVARPPVAAA